MNQNPLISDFDRTNAIADGWFSSVQLVAQFMRDRWNESINSILDRAETRHRDNCIKDLYLRATAWMLSLEKLNGPIHVQAIVAANRGLLETATDLFLLHDDKTNSSGWRMFWWAESEKLKSAEEKIEFYTRKGKPLPDQFEPSKQFYDRNKAQIEQMRNTLWPGKNSNNAKHPNRWTGWRQVDWRPKSLKDDIKNVDAGYGGLISSELGATLEEIYSTEFRQMCWFVHSGISSTHNLPPEFYYLQCAFAFRRCADLGMLCTRVVLKDFGISDHHPEFDEIWNKLKEQRILAFAEIWKNKAKEDFYA